MISSLLPSSSRAQTRSRITNNIREIEPRWTRQILGGIARAETTSRGLAHDIGLALLGHEHRVVVAEAEEVQQSARERLLSHDALAVPYQQRRLGRLGRFAFDESATWWVRVR